MPTSNADVPYTITDDRGILIYRTATRRAEQRIVEWLRKNASGLEGVTAELGLAVQSTYRVVADAIERGEHR